ncbi:hypothetical protein LTR66_006318 [Elasticomyces elasticus]|nr:hypothetical protein LTR28_013220 [Elasticomyces elasticus]KAK4992322.1 hypothetical protein LTR66_006318 [Elasticomyces elasticus]
MHYLQSSAALVAFASLAVASPVEVQNKHTFSLLQVPGPKVFRNGPVDMMKTYAKYKATAPPDVKVAAAAVQSGSVTANPQAYDESYLCPVSIGGQTLSLDFDTGSSDLWVFSTLTPSSQTTGHVLYNPNDGTSTKKDGYTWSISYGDGSGASGVVYSDKVVVGPVTATSQAVEAATSVSSSFTADTKNNGLLGLAFSSINTVRPVQQTTFFDTVKSTLAKPLFTATLKKGAPGSYDFGYIDSTKYTGSLTYVNVNTANGFWEFTATGYAIGSGSTVSSAYDSIADTGTTLLYLPPTVVSAYYAKVKGATYNTAQGGYIFPCSATLPSFTAIIGGTKHTVPGSYINYAPVSSTQCFGGIQRNTGIGFSIFGDIFLKSQFVVFNAASTPQLGFAQQA